MFNVLTYGDICGANLCISMLSLPKNPVFNWLVFGKLPEDVVVTPSNSVQVVTPSSYTRFLRSVTVEATPSTATT